LDYVKRKIALTHQPQLILFRKLTYDSCAGFNERPKQFRVYIGIGRTIERNVKVALDGMAILVDLDGKGAV